MTREPVVVEVGAHEDVQALHDRVFALLRDGSVVCDVRGLPTLEVVDALARLRLLAHRLHVELVVTGDDLGLLVLTGLEVLRQAEAPEQRGVEEVVDVLDPPT